MSDRWRCAYSSRGNRCFMTGSMSAGMGPSSRYVCPFHYDWCRGAVKKGRANFDRWLKVNKTGRPSTDSWVKFGAEDIKAALIGESPLPHVAGEPESPPVPVALVKHVLTKVIPDVLAHKITGDEAIKIIELAGGREPDENGGY